MLDDDLRPGRDPDYPDYCRFPKDEFPASWKMFDNPLSREIGDIPLGEIYVGAPVRCFVCSVLFTSNVLTFTTHAFLYLLSCVQFGSIHPDLYRGRLITIPSMFFMFDFSDSPLFELDIFAWRILAQIAGDLPLPSPEEMRRYNVDMMLHLLNDPQTRFDCDDAVVSYSRGINVKSLDNCSLTNHMSLTGLDRATVKPIPIKWISLALVGKRTSTNSGVTL